MNQLEQSLGDAQEISDELGIITGLENQLVYTSDHGLLEPYGEARAKARIEAKRAADATIGYINQTFSHIRNRKLVPISKFTAPKELIPIEDGILNIFTGEMIPYSRDLIEKGIIFTSKFPRRYKAKAECPKILNELKIAQPDSTKRYEILRSWALCFDRTVIKRQADLWIGQPDSLKSTLLKVLQAELGKENYANQPLEMLCAKDTESMRSRAQLVGKAACIFGDLQQITLGELGYFKAITGSDTVPCRFMYQSPIELPLGLKLFYSCNEPPEIEKESIWNDDAFFERFRITFFTQRLNPSEIIENYDEELTFQEELDGLFKILIGILRNVFIYRDYGYSFNPKETRDLWNLSLQKYNKIRKFVDRYCIVDENGRIQKSEFNSRLGASIREEGYEIPGSDEVNAAMRKVAREDRNGKVRCWKGIRWKDEQQSELTLYGNHKDEKDGLFLLHSNFCSYTERKIHKKPVFSVLDRSDGILRQWFGNPLQVKYPYCKRHDNTLPSLEAYKAHLKAIDHPDGSNTPILVCGSFPLTEGERHRANRKNL